jgi:hypothetical protein
MKIMFWKEKKKEVENCHQVRCIVIRTNSELIRPKIPSSSTYFNRNT